MNELLDDNEYKKWLIELKSKIQQSQIKAALAVNSQLIELYWDLGKQIVEKQEKAKWGSGFIDQLSADLKTEFPNVSGFSAYNLRRCRAFYLFYENTTSIWEQLVPKFNITNLFKIPWGHHLLILKKITKFEVSIFYVQQTIENRMLAEEYLKPICCFIIPNSNVILLLN